MEWSARQVALTGTHASVRLQRNIAQRVMEIRGQIAKEMIQDLMEVGEENSLLMRETLLTSLSLDLDAEDKGLPDV